MGPRDASTLCRLDAAQSQFQSHKDKYEKLRADVAIKLKFLEENKVGKAAGHRMGPCRACVSLGPALQAAQPCCSVLKVRFQGAVRGRAGEHLCSCLPPAVGDHLPAGCCSSVLGRPCPGPFLPSQGAGQWGWVAAC